MMSDKKAVDSSVSTSGQETSELILKAYPKEIQLRDGRKLTLRLETEEDLDRSLAFFRSLPEDVRMYLRVDVSRKEIIEKRMKHDDRHRFHRIVALDGDQIVGDATLIKEIHSWKKHLAEMRVIVHPRYQRKGLGAVLIRELYEIGHIDGVEILYSNIIDKQEGTIKICEKLGFQREIVKSKHVKDLHGQKHDLIVMTCNLSRLWHHLDVLMHDMDMGQR